MEFGPRMDGWSCAWRQAAMAALLVGVCFAALGSTQRAWAQGYQMTELAVPGSVGQSIPYSINSAGELVGAFTPKVGGTKGFLYSAGKYTILNGPPGTDGSIRALGINNAKPMVIVGDYKTSDNRFHGYMYESGHYVNYDFNSTTSSGIFGINDHGDFVGDFGISTVQGFAVIKGVQHAFYAKAKDNTYAYAINNLDAVVGIFFDSSNLVHGFLRAPTGKITEIAYPGAVQTDCFAINDAGEIAGSYTNTKGLTYGYTYSKGKYKTTDFATTNGLNATGVIDGSYWGVDGVAAGYEALPQAFSLAKVVIPQPYSDYWAVINGINKAGVMVGVYNDSVGNSHGLMIESGKVTTIDNPDGVQTTLFAINAKGQIVGDAWDSQGNPHGFLYANGTFTNVPGPSDALSSDATGINDGGWIGGDYFSGTDRTHHGFILKGTTYKEVDIPGASTTFGAGINNAGQFVVVGADAKGYTESWLYNGSKFVSIAVPGAAQNLAAGINNNGEIVYRIFDPYGVGHAALKKGNEYFVFDFPGGVNSGALGINDNGEITGFYSPAGKTTQTLVYKGTE